MYQSMRDIDAQGTRGSRVRLEQIEQLRVGWGGGLHKQGTEGSTTTRIWAIRLTLRSLHMRYGETQVHHPPCARRLTYELTRSLGGVNTQATDYLRSRGYRCLIRCFPYSIARSFMTRYCRD